MTLTEEELNNLEAMARPIEGATSSMLIPGYYVLELVRLARVGPAAEEMRRALSVIADGDGDPHEIALQTLAALPKPGSTT